MTEIRRARAADESAIRRVERAAFGRDAEAEIALRLAAREPACISLVATQNGVVVGHVLFSPVRVDGHVFAALPFALGPLAVEPACQRGGVGGALARAGLEACGASGAPFAVVLGHPSYYPRFGFVPASRFGLAFGDAPPHDAFMARELAPGALAGVRGRVRYPPEFG